MSLYTSRNVWNTHLPKMQVTKLVLRRMLEPLFRLNLVITHCQSRFCGYKRNIHEKYAHRSLPYKGPLKDDNLRTHLEKVFTPIANNAEQYADLGSSQQCEHANREVILRAPKSHHYGNSESLDFRVHATAAFINEGRDYIPQAKEHPFYLFISTFVMWVSENWFCGYCLRSVTYTTKISGLPTGLSNRVYGWFTLVAMAAQSILPQQLFGECV